MKIISTKSSIKKNLDSLVVFKYSPLYSYILFLEVIVIDTESYYNSTTSKTPFVKGNPLSMIERNDWRTVCLGRLSAILINPFPC